MQRYTLAFELLGLPPTLNSRGHWRVKAKLTKRWRLMAALTAKASRPAAPLSKARVTLTRFSSNEPDFDNLAGSFKPILDGLKSAGIILDDKRSVIGRPTYNWEHAPRGSGKVRVEVEEITPNAA